MRFYLCKTYYGQIEKLTQRKGVFMKNTVLFLLIFSLVFVMAGCQSSPDISDGGNANAGVNADASGKGVDKTSDSTEKKEGEDKDGDVYDSFVIEAGYGPSEEMYAEAENAELVDGEGREHLPIFRFDNRSELDAFIDAYKELLNTEALRQERFDEDFFGDFSLIAVYKVATSGSYRYGMKSLDVDGTRLTVTVEQTNDPEEGTDDMAGWFVAVSLDKETAETLTELDAISEK